MKGRAGIRIKKIYGGGNYGREFRKDCIWKLNPMLNRKFHLKFPFRISDYPP